MPLVRTDCLTHDEFQRKITVRHRRQWIEKQNASYWNQFRSGWGGQDSQDWILLSLLTPPAGVNALGKRRQNWQLCDAFPLPPSIPPIFSSTIRWFISLEIYSHSIALHPFVNSAEQIENLKNYYQLGWIFCSKRKVVARIPSGWWCLSLIPIRQKGIIYLVSWWPWGRQTILLNWIRMIVQLNRLSTITLEPDMKQIHPMRKSK